MGQLDRQLRRGTTVSVDGDERLTVRRPDAQPRDTAADELAAAVASRLPVIDLPDLLIEVDSWTGFTGHLTHANATTPRAGDLDRQLFAALLAHGCNLGITRMARAADISPAKLGWTSEWHLRSETLHAAQAAIVDFHHALPLAGAWGSGTHSSSDGKRYPVGVQSAQARALPRYFGHGRGVTFYTWTSDQHSHYASRVIRTTVRDATHVLDGILDNQTELPIAKHSTDTAGYSDIVFALFDLLGLQFAPRLAGLADQRLWHLNTPPATPAGRLLRHRANPRLIAEHWDDLLRIAASLRTGTVTASLLIARLQASARQNRLAAALQEYGRLIKTSFVLRYLADDHERRAIGRQLNKAEALHALHDALFFGNEGRLRLATLDRQSTQAACLSLIATAIVCWNTVYTQHALNDLHTQGHPLADDHLAHLTPTQHAHINLHGKYRIDPAGAAPELRPLRSNNTVFH